MHKSGKWVEYFIKVGKQACRSGTGKSSNWDLGFLLEGSFLGGICSF